MKLLWIWFVFTFSSIALADNIYFPEQAFNFSEDNAHSRLYLSPLNNTIRTNVLSTLNKTNRVELLSELVPRKKIGKEIWFDLRGIEVRVGELTSKVNLSRICWDYAHFSGVDLSGAELYSVLMRGVIFDNVNFKGTIFDSAHLQLCDFRGCNLENVNFLLSKFGDQTKFRQCMLNYARFNNCKDLSGVEFNGGVMQNAEFVNANLSGAKFINIDLTGSCFKGANLSNVDFCGSKIDNVDFTEADMSNAKLQSAILSGPLRLVRTRLSAATLGDLNLSKVDITYVYWESQNYYLGEELEADKLNISNVSNGNIQEKRKLYAQAEIIYRIFAEKYHLSGQISEYLKLRFRALETRRKLLSLNNNDTWWNIEYIWLNISKHVDGYGTSVTTLLHTFIGIIVTFSIIYLFGWTLLNKDWIRWYPTQPDVRGFPNESEGSLMLNKTHSPQNQFREKKGWQKLFCFSKMFITAIWFSINATFMFTESFVRIPDILQLLHPKEERLVPIGSARVFVGIQAILGVILFFLAVRMIILIIGT